MILEKKNFILRIDEQMYQAIARWAADEFRSINGQVEWMLHTSLKENGRLPAARTTDAAGNEPSKKSKKKGNQN